jgi:hypothetical protein
VTRLHAILSRGIPVLLAVASAAAAPFAVAADTPPATRPAPTLAPFFTPATATPKAVDADGFLQRWLLLEPIEKPNRTNTVFIGSYVRQAFATPPFTGAFTNLPRDGQQVTVAGKPLGWHALDSSLFDVKLFNFASGVGKPTYGVIFWAVTVVNSPREIHDVRLAVGSNSASMWWLNGQETATLFGDRRMVQDDVVSEPITLHKGRNILRGAVINGPGLSDFCVRFVDEKGRPITDLTTSTR